MRNMEDLEKISLDDTGINDHAFQEPVDEFIFARDVITGDSDPGK